MFLKENNIMYSRTGLMAIRSNLELLLPGVRGKISRTLYVSVCYVDFSNDDNPRYCGVDPDGHVYEFISIVSNVQFPCDAYLSNIDRFYSERFGLAHTTDYGGDPVREMYIYEYDIKKGGWICSGHLDISQYDGTPVKYCKRTKNGKWIQVYDSH